MYVHMNILYTVIILYNEKLIPVIVMLQYYIYIYIYVHMNILYKISNL